METENQGVVMPVSGAAKRVRYTDIADYFEQLSHLVSSGVSQTEALALLSDGWDQRQMGRFARQLHEQVAAGRTLAAALTSQGTDAGNDVLIGSFTAPSLAALGRMMNVSNVPEEGDDGGLRPLAEAAAHQTAATWVLVVGPIRRDEQGRMVVHVALRGPDDSWDVLPVPVRGAGSTARSGLVTAVLDRLRRTVP